MYSSFHDIHLLEYLFIFGNVAAFNNVIDHIKILTEANIDKLRVHRSTWNQQLRDALTVNGGDIENATRADYFYHFVSFNWKVSDTANLRCWTAEFRR